MKYRFGFVTNSSSSSFIVAHKLTNPDELENVPEAVKIVFKTIYNSYFYDTVNTPEKAEKFILDTYGYEKLAEALEDDADFISPLIEKVKKKIKEGYNISEFIYRYYDETGPAMLEVLEKEGLAEILQRI